MRTGDTVSVEILFGEGQQARGRSARFASGERLTLQNGAVIAEQEHSTVVVAVVGHCVVLGNWNSCQNVATGLAAIAAVPANAVVVELGRRRIWIQY